MISFSICFIPRVSHCPRCHTQEGLHIHNSYRDPVFNYRCTQCKCVFNAWTGTFFQGTHWRPSQMVLILRGFTQGVPTAQLARELSCSQKTSFRFKNRFQNQAKSNLDRKPSEDAHVEADEMFQNAGEKGVPHEDPDDPPRSGPQDQGAWDDGERPPSRGWDRGPGIQEGETLGRRSHGSEDLGSLGGERD